MEKKSPMVYNGISKIPKKFNCQFCDYHTSNRKDFVKHCGTKKHGIKWYMPKNGKNKFFECENCDYISADLADIENHFLAFNHKKKSRVRGFFQKPSTSMEDEKPTKMYECEICRKTYKYQSGYYRHKKTHHNENYESNTIINNDKLIQLLVESTENNNKLCEKMLQMEKKNNINLINNTINNNQKLNINVFLNEECKNAMNLSDFVNHIQLTLDDLDYTKNNGFVKGITNIFVKNLEELEVTKRPIHSVADSKTPQFYIKDENKWECDNKEHKLNETIDSVSKKQINQIKEWESTHPAWNQSDQGIEDYMKMVQTIMGGSNENERIQNRNQIKKELTETINVDDVDIKI